MARLELTKDDCKGIYVDRDGTRNDYGRQGFGFVVAGLAVHFEDEADASKLAHMILRRLGE